MVGTTFFLPAPTSVGATTLPTLTFLPGIPALYLLHLYILQVEEFSLNCTEAQQKRQRRPSGSIMSVGIILSLVFPGISNALINEDKSKDAPLGNCPIIEGCNQDPSYANENLDPGFKNFADDSCGSDGDWCKKEVKDPKLDGGNREAIEEDGLPCSTPLTGYNQDDPILVSKTSHNPPKAQPPWSTRSPICPR